LECGARIDRTTAPKTSAPASPAPPPTLEGERRQLTVLFCDLVGSTEIAAQLDPEEWRDLAARYRRVAAEAVGRFEGHVAQYLGDGLVAFFGYPQAHEDDAERAVRTGLAIVAAVQDVQTGSGVPLRVRVGLHTGPVVLGREAGAEAQAFGDTPNIAARVQAAAMPDTVVISAGTHRLVAGLFVVEEWAARTLKGIPEPMVLYRVRQPSGVQGRLAAAKASRRLTPLVGRERERELLVAQWERAREGEGQLAFLSGEPGIGKSRLLQTLRDHLADVPHTWVECQGSVYHQQTPFYPVVEMLKQTLHRPAAAARGALEALEQSFALAGVSRATAVPLVAPLLEIPLDDRYVSPDLSPEGQRKQLLSTLATWLMGLARIQPVVAVVEDLQWVDPSTLELHAMLAERGANAPLLLLYTARPEFRTPWPVLGHHLLLPLSRLTPRQVREMVARVTLEAVLSDAVVEALIARTDGVPLFVEELTKAVLEGQQAAAGTPRGTPPTAQEVPATLYDSLMARLDRLGEASKVAQVAAVLGRECSHALLSAVAGMSEAWLESALVKLVEAEILYKRGAAPYATYTFKHALMQDIAYETLLKARRRELHQVVAQIIRERFPAQAEAEPELLARHYEAAGLTDEAFSYYERAGYQARERSAYEESITQFRKAIALLGTMPPDPARDVREAAVQIALGGSLVAARGYAHDETAAALERAQSLYESAGDSRMLVQARLALGNLYVNRGEPDRSLVLADQVLAAGEETQDREHILQAHTHAAFAKLYQGRFRASLEHCDRVIALCEQDLARPRTIWFSGDRRASVRGVAGWVLSYLGHLDRALERAQEGVAIARTLTDPFSLGFARFMETLVHRTRRDAKAQQESAADVIAIGDAEGYPIWRGVGRIYHGLARAKLGEGATALAEITEGLALAAGTGNRGGTPGMLWSLADSQYAVGRYAEALTTIEGALALAASTGQHFFDSGLYNLKGELLLATAGGGTPEAEALFRRAIEIARAQEAKTFELRATSSLARLLQERGQPGEARALLAPVYSWFTEGFETPDLVEAKALLAALG
jgi:class 3 adenylate cyclase/tetratricopeptide (TPR) repeat protein